MNIEMPVNEGQGTVAAFPVDLQMFADDDAGGASGDAATGSDTVGGEDTGASSSDADGSDIDTGNDGGDDSGVVDQNGDDSETPDAVKKQSPEADRAFAEMRKQKQAAEKTAQQARAEIQKQRDAEFAKRFGQSHGIFTEAQYWQAMDREKQQKEAAQRQQQAQMPNQVYQQAIRDGYDPGVAELMARDAARELELQTLKQQLNTGQQERHHEKQQAQQEAIAKQIMADHDALSKKYGDLVPALEELDTATVDLMKQGVPLKAAWLTVHEDDVLEFAKTKGAGKALKNVNSKSHLQSEKSGAGEIGKQIELSPGQIAAYRNLFGPKMTIAEMKQREAAFRKKRGK